MGPNDTSVHMKVIMNCLCLSCCCDTHEHTHTHTHTHTATTVIHMFVLSAICPVGEQPVQCVEHMLIIHWVLNAGDDPWDDADMMSVFSYLRGR